MKYKIISVVHSWDLLKRGFVKSVQKNTNAELILIEKKEAFGQQYKHQIWAEEARKANCPVVLMDTDTIVLKDIDEVFKQDFDIAVTARDNDLHWLNAGVVFVKPTDKAYDILDLWTEEISHSRNYKKKTGHVGFAQPVFAWLYTNNKFRGKVIKVPCSKYNCVQPWDDYCSASVIHVKSGLRRSLMGAPGHEKQLEIIKPYYKKSISIIITAYKADMFINRCLSSIDMQDYFYEFDDYEVLLGIDGCAKTLNAVDRGSCKKLRILMMDQNVGTYITSNTLIDNAKYDNILRFDSDDIMKPFMVSKLLSNDYDATRMRYRYINCGKISSPDRYSWGQVLFKKKVFEACGGYMPWRCSADKELIYRISRYFNVKCIDDRLFFKWTHENALTRAAETKTGSKIRREAQKNLKINASKKILKIDRVITKFTEI
ncbi:MAG: glycosyltransferase family 2 protein [Bacteroidales bacterium]